MPRGKLMSEKPTKASAAVANNTRIIFVTGGVISGIGKGIAAASIGNILKARGYSVFIQKLDPYLNIDPGVLSPYEHGEVYVTDDGGETDLDLGHYERFLDQSLTRDSNYTSGRICKMVFDNERRGKYQGKTVQIIPHFTNEITRVINTTISKHQLDFHIVEIGGTVGDVESNAFIIAASQYGFQNPANTFYVHITYVPWLSATKEHKTKPTQHSLSLLASNGIRANMVLLRAHTDVGREICQKIANFSFLDEQNVVSLYDVDNVYEIPLYLDSKKVGISILEHFNLPKRKANMSEWENFINKTRAVTNQKVHVAMVGKYTELEDSYKSIREALIISGAYNQANIEFKWISAETLSATNLESTLRDVDGVVVLPGFGERGFEGKLLTVDYTRKHQIPTLGICFGMQAMTINQARLKGISDATSREFASSGTFILDLIPGKATGVSGGTLRLGLDQVRIHPDTLAYRIYQAELIRERSRHRYEVNPQYVAQLQDEEFIFSGAHPQSQLIEICELKNHPFYIGVQYHPEFSARPLRPHRLFNAFIRAAAARHGG